MARLIAFAIVAIAAPIVGGCSMNNTSAQPPLYLANEGPYAESQSETVAVATPASASPGWGEYSGARGQAVAPAPVSNVYVGRRSY